MSTRADFYRQWRDLMRSWGFTVLEAAGWETRDAEPRTSYDPTQLYVEHHDASTTLSGNWGALAYILANKLANIVTARDGQIMLCAAGVEWHAGVGAYPGIPTNGANPRSMGDEVCNSGTEPYSDACTRSIIAGEAAWAIVSERLSPERVIGHKEWAKPEGRKQDPRIDMNQRRADVAAAIAHGTAAQEDDDMAFGDNERRLLQETKNVVDALLGLKLNEQIARLAATVATQRDDVDEKVLADQVIAGLLPAVVQAVGQEAGLSEERIGEIVEQKVRGVFADAAS